MITDEQLDELLVACKQDADFTSPVVKQLIEELKELRKARTLLMGEHVGGDFIEHCQQRLKHGREDLEMIARLVETYSRAWKAINKVAPVGITEPHVLEAELKQLIGRIRELEAERDEQEGRWQDAIRNTVIKVSGVFDGNIDGAGTDGDALDVSLAEITQGFNHVFEKVKSLEAQLTAESRLAGEWELRYDESQRLLTEARNEIKREHKDHQLTIDTFRQQEKIWKQKTAETVADFRSQVVSRCKEVAAEHKLNGDRVSGGEEIAAYARRDLANGLADEFEAMT